jgi:hypothetical protein
MTKYSMSPEQQQDWNPMDFGTPGKDKEMITKENKNKG